MAYVNRSRLACSPHTELAEVSAHNKRLRIKIKKEKEDMQTFVAMMKTFSTERQQACDTVKSEMQQVGFVYQHSIADDAVN